VMYFRFMTSSFHIMDPKCLHISFIVGNDQFPASNEQLNIGR